MKLKVPQEVPLHRVILAIVIFVPLTIGMAWLNGYSIWVGVGMSVVIPLPLIIAPKATCRFLHWAGAIELEDEDGKDDEGGGIPSH